MEKNVLTQCLFWLTGDTVRQQRTSQSFGSKRRLRQRSSVSALLSAREVLELQSSDSESVGDEKSDVEAFEDDSDSEYDEEKITPSIHAFGS